MPVIVLMNLDLPGLFLVEFLNVESERVQVIIDLGWKLLVEAIEYTEQFEDMKSGQMPLFPSTCIPYGQ